MMAEVISVNADLPNHERPSGETYGVMSAKYVTLFIF